MASVNTAALHGAEEQQGATCRSEHGAAAGSYCPDCESVTKQTTDLHIVSLGCCFPSVLTYIKWGSQTRRHQEGADVGYKAQTTKHCQTRDALHLSLETKHEKKSE